MSNLDRDSNWFTCRTCGGHDLLLVHEWSEPDGANTIVHFESGPLDQDRRPWSNSQGSGNHSTGGANTSVASPEKAAGEGHLEESSQFWAVSCADCGREVEFGWSQPGRAGRLCPAECTDFVPSEVWPEPRYQLSWHSKGWAPLAG